ncbi:hypothetical protein HPB50_021489 [Hyalomma asiaticum]|uniref:Uncharacterized protein n=1 Tax=Hyalomma asiaticum TaxID=266040 RepID=A0ACB7SG68_HYAAI|nr:hypothetical protein HPB50_021489 [Hyalomma asiaticum]
MDKRSVMMLTSVAKHEATLVGSSMKTRDGTPITKPQAVIYYNAAKKGMDYSDQMVFYYSCLRKGLKWYAVELLVESATVNAWNIRGTLEGKSTPIIKFQELAHSLFSPRQDKIKESRGRKRVHTLKKKVGQHATPEGSAQVAMRPSVPAAAQMTLGSPNFRGEAPLARGKSLGTLCTLALKATAKGAAVQ